MSYNRTAGTVSIQPGLSPPTSGGINIVRLISKVLHRWYLILAFMVAGIPLGHEITLLVKPRYTSGASILIDPKRPGSFGADSEFASMYVDTAKVASVLTLLQSGALLQHVVDALHLADDPEFAADHESVIRKWAIRSGLLKAADDTADTVEARSLRAIFNLSRAMRVARRGFTYVVDIDVTADSAGKAQRLAEAVAEGYLYDQTEAKAKAVQRDYDWLKTRLRDLRADMALHEGQVETIRQKFNLPETGTDNGSSVDQQSVTELNTQLLQAEADVAARQARYETAEHLRKIGGDLGSLSEAASSRIIEDLRKQQNDLRWKLGDLSSRYTTAYPELIETQQHLQAVNSAIDAETSRILAGMHDEYENALARQQALAQKLAQQSKEDDQGDKADGRVQLRDAQRTVDADRSLYNTFLGKLQDVEQQLTRHDPEARIISSASLPDAPSFPKPIIFVGGGAVFGGMVGTGLALLIPRRAKGFSSINDAETKLSLPVRGALPMLTRPSQIARRVPMNIVDYVMGRSLSQFTECLRALRISLRIGSVGGPHIIQITSAVAGEGKSSVAAALAVSAALSGLRTALIDADIRNPSISGIFGLWDVQGLTNILQDKLPVRVAIQRHRGLPLSIIAAGSVACPDPDLIASQLFASVVRDIAQDHDLVILDTPPVLAVSDPLVVAKVVEETVLVIDSQRTQNVLADQAVKALQAVKAPLSGLILNKVNLAKPGRYSSGYGVYGVYGPASKKLTANRA